MDDFEILKENVERLEQEQGVKIKVDKDNIREIGIEEVTRIALTYGVKMKDLFADK